MMGVEEQGQLPSCPEGRDCAQGGLAQNGATSSGDRARGGSMGLWAQSWGLSPSSTLRPGMLGTWALAPEDSGHRPLSPGSNPQRSVSQGMVLELPPPHPSSHMAGLQPLPLPPHAHPGEYPPPDSNAGVQTTQSSVPHSSPRDTVMPRWLAAGWSREPFPVTSDAEFFLTWKVIRNCNLCTWPCAGGSALVLPGSLHI